jgi:uncharacterized protein
MQFNVAQLLVEPVGATRQYALNEDIAGLDPALEPTQPLTGPVHLLRTAEGILVRGTLHTQVRLPCARCLKEMLADLEMELEEEFLCPVNPRTGLPTPISADSDAFLIDEQHILDLSEAVRQYALLALPMQPLCQPDCAGLCVHCGHDLNDGPCACPPEPPDERWAVLAQLLTDNE